MYYRTNFDSLIGNITLAADDNERLIGLWIMGQKYFEYSLKNEGADKIIENNELEIFRLTRDWLKRYFAGKRPEISELPLAPIGNDFRQRVWRVLCKIPYGKTMTYGEISCIVAEGLCRNNMSAQAVGNAVGHNPISIIIPCHRVVAKGGNLTGYAGGIEMKIKLLELENIGIQKRLSGFFVQNRD